MAKYRKDASSKKEIQCHSIPERKERDEKPCDRHNNCVVMVQTTRSHTSQKTNRAFNQLGELKSWFFLTVLGSAL